MAMLGDISQTPVVSQRYNTEKYQPSLETINPINRASGDGFGAIAPCIPILTRFCLIHSAIRFFGVALAPPSGFLTRCVPFVGIEPKVMAAYCQLGVHHRGWSSER